MSSTSSASLPLLVEHLKMRRIAAVPDQPATCQQYETIIAPMALTRMTAGYAFGGLSIGLAIQAAMHALTDDGKGDEDDWSLYSLFGHFLGPVSTKGPVRLQVETLRNSRSFQTRIVRLYAVRGNPPQSGTGDASAAYDLRFYASLDFCRRTSHARHPTTGDELHFSHVSEQTEAVVRAGPMAFVDWNGAADEKQRAKQADETALRNYHNLYDKRSQMIEMRMEPNSLPVDTLAAFLPTSAEALKQRPHFPNASRIQDRLWSRPVKPLLPALRSCSGNDDGEVLHSSPRSIALAQIVFNLDPRVIATLAVANHLPMGIAQASVSLDIAIRFHTDDNLDADAWHLYETQVLEEGHGRFYGQTRCYDGAGHNLATATQQAAHRPVVQQRRDQKREIRQPHQRQQLQHTASSASASKL